MPADVYQTQCRNQVFDAACGLARASWEVSGTVNSVTGSRASFGSALGQAAGYFNQGVVQFLTGANAGERRTVKSFASGAFAFALPWSQAIANGDTFKAWPGCDRTLATCVAKFNNRSRYRGEPFLPQPETVQ